MLLSWKACSASKQLTRLWSGGCWLVACLLATDTTARGMSTTLLIGLLWCLASPFSTFGLLIRSRNSWPSTAVAKAFQWLRATNTTSMPTSTTLTESLRKQWVWTKLVFQFYRTTKELRSIRCWKHRLWCCNNNLAHLESSGQTLLTNCLQSLRIEVDKEMQWNVWSCKTLSTIWCRRKCNLESLT